MKKLTLKRYEYGDQGTFGKIFIEKTSLAFSGELPWRENAPDVSCIPANTYLCKWVYSPHFKRFLYGVGNVAGRDNIRIHAGNFMGNSPPFLKQLHGCIALGEKLGVMNGQKAVLLSAPAIRNFESLLKKEPFLLEILDGAD